MVLSENLILFVQNYGYVAVVLFMFLESSFFPFPSEVVIPPAAYMAYKGFLDLNLVILCGILGSLLGAIFNYYIGFYLGRPFLEKHGRYLFVSEKSLKKVEYFFDKHGSISTFVGRLLPGIRQYISLPAGLAKMNIFAFSFYTVLGAGIWVCVLAFVGYTVGYKENLIREKLNEILIYVILFVFFVVGIYCVLKIKISKR